MALELKVLKLEGSSYGIRPSIYVLKGWYDETAPKSSRNSHFKGEGVFAPPRTIFVKTQP